jgi:hypothetical protein
MKKFILLIGILSGVVSYGQSILLVVDNNLITANTNSIITGLNNTIYADSYSVWDISEKNEAPDANYMLGFNMVIWYCSTDGVDLTFWENGPQGHNELLAYVIEGKPLWIIGQDLLFAEYGSAPDNFSTGEFAFDYMGLSSYDVQSYGDDGALGVSQVNRLPGIPSYFPETIKWIFPELWWVDGVTGRAGALNIYAMGPESYIFADKVCMLDYEADGNHVMSTFFDPALINEPANRAAFLEAGIKWMLPDNVGIAEIYQMDASVYPNPYKGTFNVRLSETLATETVFSVFNAAGICVHHSILESGINSIQCELQAGLYFYTINTVDQVITRGKIISY